MIRILVVEDDAPVAGFIKRGLEAEHYTVECVADGEEAARRASEGETSLVILDVGLPKVDGFEVLKHLRAQNDTLPILMLTARSRVEDRVRGLDLGADDYLVKPFSFSELSARVRALLRRGTQPGSTKLHIADLELDLAERAVVRGGKKLDLSAREFALLAYLMRNAGRCVTRAMILEHVWKRSHGTSTNLVDVYVNYLRAKLEKDFDLKLIHTVRGGGYRLSDPARPS